MAGPDEVRIADLDRTDPGVPPPEAEVHHDQGGTAVVNAEKDETEVADRDVEASDAVTAAAGGRKADGTEDLLDGMAESKRDAVKSCGTTRGRPLVD